jgi:signal peptide peptidase SppA
MFESDILAVLPDKLEGIVALREQYSINITSAEIKDALENAQSRAASKFKDVKGSIAVLPLRGFISHRATIWSEMGFESSSETFGRWFDAVIADPSIGAVVIDVNSPGGTVHGLTAISDKIFNARGTKPIIAVSNSMTASAAYWIASSADEVIADPDSLTGSIGSVAVHIEQTKMLEDLGIKATIIRSAEHKFEGSPFEELSPEAKAHIQSQIDAFAGKFIAAVARNRNTTAANVKANFGKGRVLMADEALAVGMVDRIATMENVLGRLQSTKEESTRRNGRARNVVKMAEINAKSMI